MMYCAQAASVPQPHGDQRLRQQVGQSTAPAAGRANAMTDRGSSRDLGLGRGGVATRASPTARLPKPRRVSRCSGMPGRMATAWTYVRTGVPDVCSASLTTGGCLCPVSATAEYLECGKWHEGVGVGVGVRVGVGEGVRHHCASGCPRRTRRATTMQPMARPVSQVALAGRIW